MPKPEANVRRRGKDLSIITWGAMLQVADDAANALAKDGVSVEIVDLRSVVSIDEEAILESVAKTNRVIILHEAPLTGGAGGGVRRTDASPRSTSRRPALRRWKRTCFGIEIK